MPGDDRRTRRIHDEIDAITRQSAYVRDLIAQSFEILKQPVPDTFLGRKTQEPFPAAPRPDPEAER